MARIRIASVETLDSAQEEAEMRESQDYITSVRNSGEATDGR